MEKILTISKEKKVSIRQKLLDAVSNSPHGTKKGTTDYPSEIHNTIEVPFEGSIYNNEDTRISSADIKKMYAKHTPSFLWVLVQSILSPTYKILR
jgi:hypothetical protein